MLHEEQLRHSALLFIWTFAELHRKEHAILNRMLVACEPLYAEV